MFERILVPLDGSRFSGQAVPYAVEVAKRFNSEVFLLRVVSPTPLTMFPSETGMESAVATEIIAEQAHRKDMENVRQARRYIRQQMRRITSHGVQSSCYVEMGAPARLIMDFCRKRGVSLVVMMSHGKGRIKRAIMGSVADEVLRRSAVPILIVRPRR
jgi:nucleotide-binding universal stress UspA family protein